MYHESTMLENAKAIPNAAATIFNIMNVLRKKY